MFSTVYEWAFNIIFTIAFVYSFRYLVIQFINRARMIYKNILVRWRTRPKYRYQRKRAFYRFLRITKCCLKGKCLSVCMFYISYVVALQINFLGQVIGREWLVGIIMFGMVYVANDMSIWGRRKIEQQKSFFVAVCIFSLFLFVGISVWVPFLLYVGRGGEFSVVMWTILSFAIPMYNLYVAIKQVANSVIHNVFCTCIILFSIGYIFMLFGTYNVLQDNATSTVFSGTPGFTQSVMQTIQYGMQTAPEGFKRFGETGNVNNLFQGAIVMIGVIFVKELNSVKGLFK